MRAPRVPTIVLPVLTCLCACSDYGLSSKPAEETLPETALPETTPVPEPPEPEPPAPSCASFVAPDVAWTASIPFLEPDDPTDAQGLPFWEPMADRSDFRPVALPDLAIPVGWDRAYAGTFTLEELPLNLSLNLQSDDGIWVWVNGTLVGHWGGPWQQEGCVNENAHCLVTSAVPPVDVTPWLQLGVNTLAARVSNPVLNAYFDVIVECMDQQAVEP